MKIEKEYFRRTASVIKKIMNKNEIKIYICDKKQEFLDAYPGVTSYPKYTCWKEKVPNFLLYFFSWKINVL